MLKCEVIQPNDGIKPESKGNKDITRDIDRYINHVLTYIQQDYQGTIKDIKFLTTGYGNGFDRILIFYETKEV